MIRPFKSSDMEEVLSIWLHASIQAHDFVDPDFWRSHISDMRDVYLPASETYVYDEEGIVRGFVSLFENTLAALFVAPCAQGKGIGRQLMAKSKEVRQFLTLAVYKENTKSISFYRKCGFETVREQVDKHTGHLELVMAFKE